MQLHLLRKKIYRDSNTQWTNKVSNCRFTKFNILVKGLRTMHLFINATYWTAIGLTLLAIVKTFIHFMKEGNEADLLSRIVAFIFLLIMYLKRALLIWIGITSVHFGVMLLMDKHIFWGLFLCSCGGVVIYRFLPAIFKLEKI